MACQLLTDTFGGQIRKYMLAEFSFLEVQLTTMKGSRMEVVNVLIAVASLVVAAVAGIYIPLHLHRKQNKDD